MTRSERTLPVCLVASAKEHAEQDPPQPLMVVKMMVARRPARGG
jgi:hypothetical protein